MASMIERDEHDEAEDLEAPDGAEVLADPGRLSRRAAMRAAAGGAAAAGVFLAPRFTGATLAPAYASATSGNDGSDEVELGTVTQAAPPAALCLLKCCITCWNTTGITTTCGRSVCTCGTNKSCGSPLSNSLTGQLSVPKASPPSGEIALDYRIWGPTEGCMGQNSELELEVTGIDPPFQACTVAVDVDCSVGTEQGGTNGVGGPGAPVAVTSDGPIVSIPAPSCSGSLQPQSPNRGAQEYCPAPATVTITLSCTFS